MEANRGRRNRRTHIIASIRRFVSLSNSFSALNQRIRQV
jgi:hypothetical protein